MTDVSPSNYGAAGGMQSNEGGHDTRNDYGDALKQEVLYMKLVSLFYLHGDKGISVFTRLIC